MKNFKALIVIVTLILAVIPVFAQGDKDTADNSKVTTIEFIQWWENEMKEGSLQQIISDFEAKNPDIKVKLVSLPYGEVQDQILIQGAAGTLPELVGINPPLITTFKRFGFFQQLDVLLENDGMNKDDFAIKYVDGETWMMPITSYVYPLYYNKKILAEHGFSEPPKSYSEFIDIVKKTTNRDKGIFGFVFPLSLTKTNGSINDVLPFTWSAGYETVIDGKANVNTQGMVNTLTMVKYLYDNNFVSPGALAKTEAEKVEEFVNERTAMMISSTAHINLLRSRNPELDFGITTLPGPDNYTGKSTTRIVGWDVGISSGAEGKKLDAAWRLLKYLTSQKVNGILASSANAFPGNKKSNISIPENDEIVKNAVEIYRTCKLMSPLVGLPDTKELQRIFNEELHAMLNNEMSEKETAESIQTKWSEIIK